jgi:hypothetical protein
MRDGYNMDVPNYSLSPEESARDHWHMTKKHLPTELLVDNYHKSQVWLEVINEVDKNRADWLGFFGVEIAKIAYQEGYKVALFGWSSGEPEDHHWREPGMVRFLEHAALNPDRLAVALHEYSYSDDIWDGYTIDDMDQVEYWKVGRFTRLFDVCDDLGITRPTTLITEWGWHATSIPDDTDDFIVPVHTQIEQVGKFYDQYPEVKMAGLWYLGGGYSNIANSAQRLIAPVGVMALEWEDLKPPEPPGPGETDEQRWWDMTVEEQITCGIQFANTAIQRAILDDLFYPVTKEMYVEGEPPMMAAEDLDWAIKQRPRRVYVWQNDSVRWFNDPTGSDPPEPPAQKYDLAEYMVTMFSRGILYEVQTYGAGQERHQTHVEGSVFYHTKGGDGPNHPAQWEQLKFDHEYIYRFTDTSPGQGKYYQLRDVPEVYTRNPQVTFYHKSNCEIVSNARQESLLKLEAVYETMQFFTGISLQDVIQLTWLDMNRSVIEHYYYAKGYGLVGWEGSGKVAAISEIHEPGQRPDNVREEIGCM